MSSCPDDFEDDYDNFPDGPPLDGEDGFVDILTCTECNKEFEVAIDFDPDKCPHCGAFFE